MRLAFEQRRVFALCLGDVAGDFRGADDPPGLVTDRRYRRASLLTMASSERVDNGR